MLSSTIPYLLFPSISYSSFFFSSSSSSCSSSLRRFGEPPGTASTPAGTCRTGTGLLLPQFSKYWQDLNYSQVTKKWWVSQDSVFQIFVILTELEEVIKNWKRTKEPKTKVKRTKNKTKKNQKEPLRTKWQFWYFPQWSWPGWIRYKIPTHEYKTCFKSTVSQNMFLSISGHNGCIDLSKNSGLEL